MLRVVGVLVLLALYISFIIDVLRTPRAEARGLPKAVWLLVVVLVPILGGVFWFFLGRPRPAPGSRFGRRRGPMAPDDDPRFLRRIDEEAWREKMKKRRERDSNDQ
jgi:hypothetical protein